MTEKYVILRSVPVANKDVFLGRAGGAKGVKRKTMKLDVDDIDSKKASKLSEEKGVLAVAQVMPMKLIKPVAPKAKATAVKTAWGVQAVRADTSTLTGDGITVAVLDSGIDKKHPAFKGVTLTEEDFTGEGNGDTDGHGTHCAGTVFGRDVANTRIGIARGVTKALIGKVIGQDGGSTDAIANGIQWAVTQGANVISMSLGMDFPRFREQLRDAGFPDLAATSRALEVYRANVRLFDTLAEFVASRSNFGHTTLIVAASGNESERTGQPSFTIAASPPAVCEGFISVAALGQGPSGFVVAPFSNIGAKVAGPGVAITSAEPGGGLVDLSGTSMATPHVAGVAALLAQQLTNTSQLNTFQLTAQLVGSASVAGLQAGFEPADVGAGMVQAPQH